MGLQSGLSRWRAGAREWLSVLSDRLERVRLIHGDWTRTLNHHYGGDETAIFFDPPYRAFEHLYARGSDSPVADQVAEWCRTEGADLRVALCGHRGDYDLPGWDVVEWSRGRLTYGGGETTEEAIWFSPGCLPVEQRGTLDLFANVAPSPADPGEDDFDG